MVWHVVVAVATQLAGPHASTVIVIAVPGCIGLCPVVTLLDMIVIEVVSLLVPLEEPVLELV